MQPLVVERAPGARAGSSAARSPGRRARPRQLAAGDRPPQAGQASQVGEQRALDLGHDHRPASRTSTGGWPSASPSTSPFSSCHPDPAAGAVPRGARITGSGVPGVSARARMGASSTPSTSMPTRSGAASSSAVLIASSRVDAEAGQPSQLPSQPQPGDAVLEPEQLDVAAVGLHVGAHVLERLRHPLLERDRVEVVDQQQARHHAVDRRGARGSRPGLAGLVDRRDDPLQAVAVAARSRRRAAPARSPASGGSGSLLDLLAQLLDALDQHLALARRLHRL